MLEHGKGYCQPGSIVEPCATSISYATNTTAPDYKGYRFPAKIVSAIRPILWLISAMIHAQGWPPKGVKTIFEKIPCHHNQPFGYITTCRWMVHQCQRRFPHDDLLMGEQRERAQIDMYSLLFIGAS